MNEEINGILQGLTNKNELVSRVEEELIEILDKPGELNLFELRLFAENLKEEIRLASDAPGRNRPFYYFYLAVSFQALNENEQAKQFLARAIHIFRIKDLALNEALGEWFFAKIHLEGDDNMRAERACETAIGIMMGLVRAHKEEGHYRNAEECAKHLVALEILRNSIKMSLPLKVKVLPKRTPPPTDEDFMVLPWLLKYDSVQAGPNGPIWVVPPADDSAVIHTIEIDRKSCVILSLNSSTKAHDHQITLIRGMDYGWAMVRGHSMNAHRPPIEENDYVLFTKQWHQDQDAIVIACEVLTQDEHSYMVKKYVAKDCQLVSETRETAQDYPLIQMNDRYQILGTVIAVAKPSK